MRRTSTIDAAWPDGMAGETILAGRARDLVTARDGSVHVVAAASLRVVLDHPSRDIVEIVSSPRLPALADLVGQPAMGGHRARVVETLPAEVAAASLLYRLLDDLPGATLVSGAAFRPWYGIDRYLEGKQEVRRRVMTDICTGYQSGSSALNPDGTLRWEQNRAPADEIGDGDDLLAWHRLTEPTGISMRRARRLDVVRDESGLRLDGFYQDSGTLPDGGRTAIHEYVLTAESDADEVVTSVSPVPRVLPYHECPLATLNTTRLVGGTLQDLRTTVLRDLAGPAGCTHLNDMLRSLSDAPALARTLAALSAQRSVSGASSRSSSIVSAEHGAVSRAAQPST
ncbi:DUF2889 domain-containing protein [Nocardioides sp. cx-169]|uniref:DUF2889 domain-containing protein n=1 Tax=Nocardioides sp. cx-169 TaxID=2899080 RepID=UPI001E350AF5|nr:DUF2889 domain-containing protein [Nocardioides sp. cx-169]MCD4533008.1 DUF2889 domain-containing protein [Nocardioides sp. cx-169]